MTNEKTNGLADDSKAGHYRIAGKTDAGGMGEVYPAEDLRPRRKIALKVLPENIAWDKPFARRPALSRLSATNRIASMKVVRAKKFGNLMKSFKNYESRQSEQIRTGMARRA